MGKIRENLNTFLLLFILATLVACNRDSKKTGTLLDFVPAETSLVLKFTSLSDLKNDIKQNNILGKFIGKAANSKFSQLSFVTKEESIFNYLNPSSESLICFNKSNDSISTYTFISRNSKHLFLPDSIKDKTIEALEVDNLRYDRVTIGKDISYTTIMDSVFIATSSQITLQKILKGEILNSKEFHKVYTLPRANGVTILIQDNKISLNDSTAINLTSWSSMDLHLTPESMIATGITTLSDSIPQLLEVFKGQIPQQNDFSHLIPHNAKTAVSFTFSDPEKFQKKLSEFRKETNNNLSGIFDAANEVGEIQLGDENIIFVKSIDANLSNDVLAKYVSAKSSFRDIDIKSFNEPQLFQKYFSPLISGLHANYMFQMDNFFVFTEKETTAETMISLILNKATLKSATYFEKASSDLSNASSLLIFNLDGNFSKNISEFFKLAPENKIDAFKNIPLASFQFTFDRNFAHIIVSAKEMGTPSSVASGTVSEKFNLKLENDILGEPQYFTNPGKASSNILVQDIKNQLHFITESGKILWSKNLKTPILGEIHEIDFYNNGNLQMAFTTKDAFYIFDRTGKELGTFPLRFKDEITQPLAVFDYDNNHKYRFVITQGKNILMYDKNGKTVKGFGFSKTVSPIAKVPQHIRMGNKDYINIAEENGTLHILNRVGQTRVPVSKKYQFSDVPITFEDKSFVIITKDNLKEIISETGKVSSVKLDVGNHYWYATSGSTKVTLDDNLLRINGKLTELPLGIYSNPNLYNINRNTYITITETQEKKVYVFDKNGNILNGFPVYGTSEARIGKNNSKNGFLVLVKDNSNSLIGYEF